MKYAIIAIAGSQYKVEEDKTITVSSLNINEGESSSTSEVLLVVNDDKIMIGNPHVKGASVEFKITKNYQGEKIKVFKYKSKSRYRRTQGFRAQLSDIQITKINF